MTLEADRALCLHQLEQRKDRNNTWTCLRSVLLFLSHQGMSDSLWPRGLQPTRLPRPWDSPGKNTGVGWHFLLKCIKVKSVSEVAQLCPSLSDPMDWSLPGYSVHGIFQARVLEWCAITFSKYMHRKTKTCKNRYFPSLSVTCKITFYWKNW